MIAAGPAGAPRRSGERRNLADVQSSRCHSQGEKSAHELGASARRGARAHMNWGRRHKRSADGLNLCAPPDQSPDSEKSAVPRPPIRVRSSRLSCRGHQFVCAHATPRVPTTPIPVRTRHAAPAPPNVRNPWSRIKTNPDGHIRAHTHSLGARSERSEPMSPSPNDADERELTLAERAGLAVISLTLIALYALIVTSAAHGALWAQVVVGIIVASWVFVGFALARLLWLDRRERRAGTTSRRRPHAPRRSSALHLTQDPRQRGARGSHVINAGTERNLREPCPPLPLAEGRVPRVSYGVPRGHCGSGHS